MKVSLPINYRQRFTLEQLEQAKNVIKLCKEDTSNPADYAQIAINEIIKHGDTGASWLYEIHNVKATVEPNMRCHHDQYGDDTGFMDVELDIVAETDHGFIHAWCRMIDIWQIDGEHDFASNWYYKYYRES